ncbi:hypothetical protein BZL39_J00720 [Zygosaccharomyces parabailii]|uniref:ZYBA0S03-11738g1_1 n=1 Tax=Zygosaccharomyces bailii (strain CLIB 213 / ATCC 58445 / CBS 680 / BCRC 21525 / NBRC 1098 / NCYC 1416 / NRRL Y-2227) TaxID=1333698 RepID=A0A8J2X7L8_ZYGB2|nr:hypothetical protein BZL39_J00720 [Zygosaccharomyces parabailii]CDF89209.1 ZYBA0S03-11738g1_1 [Zygosaccharomyces bailii CLIB 213]
MEKLPLTDPETCEQLLPKDLFKNRFTWGLHEVRKYYLPSVMPFLCLLVAYILISVDCFGNSRTRIISITLCIVVAFCFPPIWFFTERRRIISQHRVKIAEAFLMVNEESKNEPWNQVACQMNQFFFEGRYWNTSNFFFDDKQFSASFRKHLLIPFHQGISENNFIHDKKNPIHNAIASYQQLTNLTFANFMKNFMVESAPEQTALPRDKYRNKLTFHKKYFTSWMFLGLMLVVSYSIVSSVRSKKPSNLLSTASHIFDAFVYYSFYCNHKRNKLGVKSMCKFLATIISVAPGCDTKRWDIVAMHMNQYLHNEEIWRGEQENFFDGRDCMDFFSKGLKPLASEESSAYPELKTFVCDALKVCESK